MFSRGSSKGLITGIPAGGHCEPISTAGARLLCRYAQKTETKKNTSLRINSATPIVIPFCTGNV